MRIHMFMTHGLGKKENWDKAKWYGSVGFFKTRIQVSVHYVFLWAKASI